VLFDLISEFLYKNNVEIWNFAYNYKFQPFFIESENFIKAPPLQDVEGEQSARNI
jgi:DNA polymerase III psi subunit